MCVALFIRTCIGLLQGLLTPRCAMTWGTTGCYHLCKCIQPVYICSLYYRLPWSTTLGSACSLLPTKMCHDIRHDRVPPPLPRLTRGTIRVSKVSAGGTIPRLLMSYCSQSFLSSYPRFPLMPPFLGNANCTLWLLNNTIVLRTSYTFWGPVILCEDHLYFVRTTHIKYTINLQA